MYVLSYIEFGNVLLSTATYPSQVSLIYISDNDEAIMRKLNGDAFAIYSDEEFVKFAKTSDTDCMDVVYKHFLTAAILVSVGMTDTIYSKR